ncbi:hypothetical protein NQ314_019512 [Rhamnusium bicolor]|uniref:AB hydrolase-1 domain-containing protein n=1 Tax=Rhamnusium bicolor TaxID=1586634 RepID=A0AAV8WMP3_9CUCU|nr:hypothetical protein NQ314_019512 [Rhamnusium bicolor]
MLWIHILVGFLFLENIATVRVCETFSDYFVKNSKKCWNNTDAELNAYKKVKIVQMVCKIKYFNFLAHVLNEMGYDVWLVNFRGTRYSTGHEYLTVDNLEYWSFSFHEMGIYDLPKALNLVLKTTNKRSIYIGYSMGTTVSYVFSSELPVEASSYLKGIISLAPVAHLSKIKSILKYGAPFWPMIKPAVTFIWKGKVLPRNDAKGKFCGKDVTNMYICEFIKVPIFGDDYEQMDPVNRPVINILNPDTIGINVVTHYDQIINSGKFQQKDFGRTKNIEIYDAPKPPVYNLSNINIPVSLFVGPNDWLATPKVSKGNILEITSAKCNLRYIAHKKWSHGDFITAKDIKPLLNDLVAIEITNIELCSINQVRQDYTTTNLLK